MLMQSKMLMVLLAEEETEEKISPTGTSLLAWEMIIKKILHLKKEGMAEKTGLNQELGRTLAKMDMEGTLKKLRELPRSIYPTLFININTYVMLL